MQLTACARQDDPETVGRHHRLQAIGERTKQNVAIQVVTNGTVHVEKCRGFKIEATEILVRFAQLFMSLLALQLGTPTRCEYLQHGDVLFRRFHRLLVQHRQVPERSALRIPHRHTDIALCADLLQPEILREFRRQAG